MKVLIVTYYWPPAGGPGVQRWLKFVKYFRDFGIEPVVYVPKNPTYPLYDTSLLNEVPKDIEIISYPILEPYGLSKLFSSKETKTISKGIIASETRQSAIQKLLLYIRGNFFVPDARRFWIKPSIKYLKTYLKTQDIDTVITTGPPHSMHMIGEGLRQELDIKWIADFRDPWTTIGYHNKLRLSKRSFQKHKSLEKQVLRSADHIVVTSFTTADEFRQITEQTVSVITNGYDIEAVPEIDLDSKFTISHIGSLLSGRNPYNLWRALFDLTQEHDDFAKMFQLQLVGSISDDVLQTIKKAGLGDFLKLKGYVSHHEAIGIQRSSQVLLLVEIDRPETKCIIPGKLFEYMISKRPILALGPKGADISKLIDETGAGSFFEYHEYKEVKIELLRCFELFKKEKLTSQVKGIEKYSRRELTRNMSELIKHIN